MYNAKMQVIKNVLIVLNFSKVAQIVHVFAFFELKENQFSNLLLNLSEFDQVSLNKFDNFNNSNNNNTNSQNDNTENNDNNTDSGVPVNAKGYINFRLREDIDLHFMAHEQIGNGTFGRIHRIRYQGQDMALKIVYQDPDYG
mgnify:CR=1 FL=1